MAKQQILNVEISYFAACCFYFVLVVITTYYHFSQDQFAYRIPLCNQPIINLMEENSVWEAEGAIPRSNLSWYKWYFLSCLIRYVSLGVNMFSLIIA